MLNLLPSSLLALIATIALVSPALAVGSSGGGGGGGGGGSSGSGAQVCSEDIWNCSDWNACASDGRQTRNCTLFFDCPYTYTPKPNETRTCTPPTPTPMAPSPASKPSAAPAPTPDSPTSSLQISQPVCDAYRWGACSNWSSTCDRYGYHTRTCERSLTDCNSASTTPAPLEKKRCEKLQCGKLTQLRERILCRLKLAPEGITRELELQYLPEECRVIKKDITQKQCIARYAAYHPCWDLPAGEARFNCARKVLQLEPDITQAYKDCRLKKASKRTPCLTDLRHKVFSLIKFRFYDLNERAEELIKHGTDVAIATDTEVAAATDLILASELSKQKFNQAKIYAQRHKLIQDVSSAWKTFVKHAQPKDARDNLDQALRELDAVK